MSYSHDLGDGRQLLVENNGDNTTLALSSGGDSQRQSQGTGFTTGKWTKDPVLFRSGGREFFLRLETSDGARFVSVRGDQIQSMHDEPDLSGAEELRMEKSDKPVGMKPMEPMKPMRGMAPMEPMKPMEPMRPMGS